MMRYNKYYFVALSFSVLLVLTLLFSFPAVASQPLTIMTENFPPYNYQEGEALKGPCVDIVKVIMNELNIQSAINVLPWPRAYHIIQQQDNQVLFSMARTPSRENLFKWVGPLVKYDVYLYNKKGMPASIHSPEEAKRYTFGVKKDTAGHNYLKQNGFEKIHIDYSPDKFNLPKLLVFERIDMWLMGEISAPYMVKLAGFSPEDIEPAFSLFSQELYIAFSKSTPDRIINNWQNTLDQLKSSGKYKEILSTH